MLGASSGSGSRALAFEVQEVLLVLKAPGLKGRYDLSERQTFDKLFGMSAEGRQRVVASRKLLLRLGLHMPGTSSPAQQAPGHGMAAAQ